HAYLGDVLIHQNDFANAKAELGRAVLIDSKLPLIHLDLGIVYVEESRNEDAIREFRKAIALDPNDADPHWRLAKGCQAIGKKQDANAEFALVRTMKKVQQDSLYKQISGAHPSPQAQAIDSQWELPPTSSLRSTARLGSTDH